MSKAESTSIGKSIHEDAYASGELISSRFQGGWDAITGAMVSCMVSCMACFAWPSFDDSSIYPKDTMTTVDDTKAQSLISNDGSLVSRLKPVFAKAQLRNKILIDRKLIDYDNLTLAYDLMKAQHADLDDPECGADTCGGCYQWDDDFTENGDEFTIATYPTEYMKNHILQETEYSKPPLTPKSARKYKYDTPVIEEVDNDTYASSPRHCSDTPLIMKIDETSHASFDGMYDNRDEYSVRDVGQINWRY